MGTMGKCVALSCLGVTGIVGLLFIKIAWHNHNGTVCEKAGKSLDNTLKESVSALDKATTQVKGVFEHIKNMKA